MKIVIIIGRESTGSRLIAKICAHLLDVAKFGTWDGQNEVTNGSVIIDHKSIPNGTDLVSPKDLMSKYIYEYGTPDIRFIIPTRCEVWGSVSRKDTFHKSYEQEEREGEIALDFIDWIVGSEYAYMFWSYETFMFLKYIYIKQLINFLPVNPTLAYFEIPGLRFHNANRKRYNDLKQLSED